MTKLEQNAEVESLELPDGGKPLKEELEAKKDALENLPTHVNVKNRSCKY